MLNAQCSMLDGDRVSDWALGVRHWALSIWEWAPRGSNPGHRD